MDALRVGTTTPRDLADKVREGTQYVVEKLRKHRKMEDGTTEFLIK